MKKTISLFALLFSMFSLFCSEFDTFRISKIQIFCDKAEYTWTTDGLERMDEDRTKVVLNAETIITFLSVQPGFYGTEKEIQKRCEDSQRRMTDSGYFYESSIRVAPPEKFLAERTLIVSVSPGYFMRYGGGSVWGMYGLIGIGGERQSLYAYAGYNKNGLHYRYSNFEGTPFSFGSSLFYFGPGEYFGKLDTEKQENRFSSSLTLEWAYSTDLAIGIEPTFEGVGISSRGYFSLQPFFSKKMYLPFGSNSEYGFSGRGFWYPVINVIKTQATGYFRLGITEEIMFAAKGSLGASPFVLSAPISFDLYYTEDRAVRSGYLRDALQFSNFGFASAEMRYDFFTYRFPPMLDVKTQVFSFTDFATNMDVGRDFEFLDAFGIGFRVLFQNPIFAYFTISYGINNLGDGRFFFCGTAGY